MAGLGSLIEAETSLPAVWRMTQWWVGWLEMRVARGASALTTGTHSDIAASDQIRPIATTTAIPIPMRICISCASELGEIEDSHIFQRPSVR